MAIKQFTKVIAVAAAFSTMPVLAGTQTWDLDNANLTLSCIVANGCSSGTGHGNEINMTSGTTSMRMTGWSDTGNSSTDGMGVTMPYDGNIQTAKMVNYASDPAHWGITNQDESASGGSTGSPQHAVDNGNGSSSSMWADYDFFLLEFSEAVNLSHVSIDWSGNNDSDISVAAFNSNPVDKLAEPGDKTIAQLLTDAGAFFKDSIGNVPDDGSYYSIGDKGTSGTDGIFAQYWLVSAYTPLIQAGLSDLNDAMKFSGWKTATAMTPPNDVPSPGSLALVLAGLLAMRGRERKPA